jgi:hypothetical protein
VTVSQEIDFLTEVAERYRGEGYQVLREPPSSKLPRELRAFQPDLLAMKGKQRVVVEIKRASRPLELEELKKLKRSVEALPGWRLDVVWLGDKTARTSGARQPLSNGEIRNRVDEIPVGKSRQAQELELMALWAYFEAAIRNRLAAVGEDEPSPIPPSSLVRKAISFGLLPQRELAFLDDLAHTRNQVAHGFKVRKQLSKALKQLRKLITKMVAAPRHH